MNLNSTEGLYYLSTLSLKNVALANQIRSIKCKTLKRKERNHALQKESDKLLELYAGQLQRQEKGQIRLNRARDEVETLKELVLERGFENHELQANNEKLAKFVNQLERLIIDTEE